MNAMVCTLLLMMFATGGGVVRGVVRSAGEALPGVTVYVKGAQESVVTGADGRFEIAVEGEQTLVAFLGGFEASEVKGKPGDDLAIELRLAVVAESVTVTAKVDRDVPMSTFETRPLDIVRTPGAQADVFRALQTLPGVAKVDEGAGLFVRGGDVSEVRVLLDGTTIHHPYRYESPSGGQFGAVEPFLLQGVSFSTGGFSARFGNALSAIVDLRGLGTPRSTAYTATAGLAGLAGRVALPGGENQGIRASGNLRFPRLLFAVNGAPREFDQYPGGWDFNVSAHYGRLKLFATEQRTSVGVSVEEENFNGFLHASTRHDVLAASWKGVWRNDWQVSSSFGGDLYSNRTDVGVVAFDNQDTRLSWRLDVSRAIGATILRLGTDADAAHHEVQGTTSIRGGDFTGANGTRALDVQYRDWHGGVYAEVERTFGRFTPTLGVRADQSARAGEWLDTRFNVTYALARKQQLRVAWGIYHQAPSSSYYDRVHGTDGLKPMRAEHRILGYELGDPEQPLHVRIEAYEKRYDDLPLDDASNGFTSAGFGYARGIDLYVQKQFERVQLRGSYSFLDAERRWTPHEQRQRFALPDETWEPDFAIPHSLELIANIAATARLSFGVGWNQATGRPFTPIVGATATPTGFTPVYGDINSDRLPPYQRFDLSSSYRIVRDDGRAVVYFLSVSNALARENAFEYSYSADFSQRTPVVSAAPRSFYAGFSITR